MTSEPTAAAPETARERQVREAEEIARRNREWTWHADTQSLVRAGGGWVMLHPFNAGRSGPVFWTLSVAQKAGRRRYDSPAAAIRALGFQVNEGGTDG